MFGGWTFLYGMFRAFKMNKKPNLLTVFFLGTMYGLLIEVLQFILPTNRSPELLDFIADMTGALVAIGVLHVFFKKIFSTSTEPTT